MGAAPAVLSRFAASEVPCPVCSRPLIAQEMCLASPNGSEGTWVAARRFCLNGCLLVGVEIPGPRPPSGADEAPL